MTTEQYVLEFSQRNRHVPARYILNGKEVTL